MKDTLASLKQQATTVAVAQNVRRRTNYKLARRLGFPPAEAQIMAGWSQERILALAGQKERP